MKFEDVSDVELLQLKKEISELKYKLQLQEEVLSKNGLLESVPSVSETEDICVQQISMLLHVSKQGISFDTETAKLLETFAKTLAIARGKMPLEEKKGKKEKAPAADIGKLLKIAERKE